MIDMVSFRYKNQSVAIKMVPNGDSPEEIAKREARFAREVAMLSKVKHKNLVTVICSNIKAMLFISILVYVMPCIEILDRRRK